MSDITPEQVIAQIDEWRDHEVRCEVLSGAITNHNYLVTVDGETGRPGVGRFVLRIPGGGTETFIDREHEHRNRVAAAAAGVAPPVLHLVQPGYCTIVPFIRRRDHAPRDHRRPPRASASHRRGGPHLSRGGRFDNEIWGFDMIRDYARMASKVDAPRPYQIEWMLWVGQRIEQAMQRDEPAPVACHNNRS